VETLSRELDYQPGVTEEATTASRDLSSEKKAKEDKAKRGKSKNKQK
jgi:hypothetical protein